jgi:hypothetical protein
LVEHTTENRGVAGSIPALATPESPVKPQFLQPAPPDGPLPSAFSGLFSGPLGRQLCVPQRESRPHYVGQVMHDPVDIQRRIHRLFARVERRDDYGQLLRHIVKSIVVAHGAFNGVGTIVEVATQPGDGDDIFRDDLVFPQGTLHLVTTNLAVALDVIPQTCRFTESGSGGGVARGSTRGQPTGAATRSRRPCTRWTGSARRAPCRSSRHVRCADGVSGLIRTRGSAGRLRDGAAVVTRSGVTIELVRIQPRDAALILDGQPPASIDVAPDYPTEFSHGIAASVSNNSPLGPFFMKRIDDGLAVGEIGGGLADDGMQKVMGSSPSAAVKVPANSRVPFA